ncbi:MAG: hypothetical protein, partial [Olavius algarvensis Gamma 1 endosymbiont]
CSFSERFARKSRSAPWYARSTWVLWKAGGNSRTREQGTAEPIARSPADTGDRRNSGKAMG